MNMKELFRTIFNPEFRRKKSEERFWGENDRKVEEMGREASLLYKARAEVAKRIIEEYRLTPTNSEKVLGGTEELILVNTADFKRYIWGRKPSTIRLYFRGLNDYGGIYVVPTEEKGLMIACNNHELIQSPGESQPQCLMRILGISSFLIDKIFSVEEERGLIKIDWDKAPA